VIRKIRIHLADGRVLIYHDDEQRSSAKAIGRCEET